MFMKLNNMQYLNWHLRNLGINKEGKLPVPHAIFIRLIRTFLRFENKEFKYMKIETDNKHS